MRVFSNALNGELIWKMTLLHCFGVETICSYGSTKTKSKSQIVPEPKQCA